MKNQIVCKSPRNLFSTDVKAFLSADIKFTYKFSNFQLFLTSTDSPSIYYESTVVITVINVFKVT